MDAEYERAGSVISFLRNQLGLTQEKLCDGIMDRSYLSRLETGDSIVNKKTMDALLNRLGYLGKRFYTYALSASEFEVYEMRDELAMTLDIPDIENAARIIGLMSRYPQFKQGLHKQFLLKSKAALCLKMCEDTNLAQNYLTEAIHITLPEFSERFIGKYLLTTDDIEIIAMMAQIHDMNDRHEEAINLFGKLAESIRNRYIDAYEKTRLLSLVLYELSTCLINAGKYTDALKLCDEAAYACQKNKVYGVLPMLLANKSTCLYALDKQGNLNEIKDLLNQAYFTSIAFGRYAYAAHVREYASTHCEVNIGLSPICED